MVEVNVRFLTILLSSLFLEVGLSLVWVCKEFQRNPYYLRGQNVSQKMLISAPECSLSLMDSCLYVGLIKSCEIMFFPDHWAHHINSYTEKDNKQEKLVFPEAWMASGRKEVRWLGRKKRQLQTEGTWPLLWLSMQKHSSHLKRNGDNSSLSQTWATTVWDTWVQVTLKDMFHKLKIVFDVQTEVPRGEKRKAIFMFLHGRMSEPRDYRELKCRRQKSSYLVLPRVPFKPAWPTPLSEPTFLWLLLRNLQNVSVAAHR